MKLVHPYGKIDPMLQIVEEPVEKPVKPIVIPTNLPSKITVVEKLSPQKKMRVSRKPASFSKARPVL